MKCLAISNSYPPDHAGGYELGACNLLESLTTHCGWQNTVVASVRNEKSPKTHSLKLTGFFPGKLGPGIALWRTGRELLKNHDQLVTGLRALVDEADLVFVFNPRRLIYPQWTSVLDCGKPAFVFVSDHWPQDPLASDLFYTKSKKPPELIYQGMIPGPQMLGKFTGALFGSRFLHYQQASAFGSTVHQAVAHWGIAIDQFPETLFSETRLKTFGFCGRPEKEKGLDLALSSFRQIAQKDKQMRLLVASDLAGSAYGRSILKQVKGDPVLSKCVTLLGQIPHAELHERLYSRIGILLFPSIWQEPFALTVLEAMASGALVIASATGGTPEVVDEKTGYLFNPEKEGDLTNVCRKALEAGGENACRVAAGAKRIRQLHSLKHMAEKVDAFIRPLL